MLRRNPSRTLWRLLGALMLVLILPLALPAQDDQPGSDLPLPEEAPDIIQGEQTGEAAPQPETPEATPEELDGSIDNLNAFLDSTIGWVNTKIVGNTIFLPIPIAPGQSVPLVLLVLIGAAVFFTFRFKFINITGFTHAIQVVRGKYDDPNDEGDISHFRALTSALSATVGLGNIAGVAVAISLGGPGAVLWMTLGGFFGMASKFTECTLGQMYRKKNIDGTISGGPQYYLHRGLEQLNPALGPFGKALAILFSFCVMCAAVGGGNMFQANQSFEAVQSAFGVDAGMAPAFGIMMMVLVGVVILGGITRIGATTARIVPIMAAIYVLASLVIILGNITQVPAAVGAIFKGFIAPEAAYGGIVGVLIQGIRRSAFSNEAGIGSAAIAHSAAKTREPVREGIVALLEPFIDTVIICNMTALVIILTGAYAPETSEALAGDGVAITQHAFSTVIPWFPYVLAACVILFAYSTMISWAYYGERGWIYLLDHFGEGVGLKTLFIFRLIFVAFVYIGTVVNLGAVIDFSDGALFSMAFPNLIGCVLLSGVVAAKLKDYLSRLESGQMHEYKPVEKDEETGGLGI